MNEIPCPDGYLLDPASPLADGHHALNTYLVRVEEAGWKAATKELNSLRDKGLKFRIWMALLDRLDRQSSYFSQLHDLTYSIEEWKLSLNEADLLAVLRRTSRLSGNVVPYTPMPHLMAYVEEHGLTAALSATIREFDAWVRKQKYTVNQTRLQLINSRLDMLAWWDEWNEVDVKRCWSEQIRADFRAMQGTERAGWRKILHSIQGDEGVRPARKWLEMAEGQIQAIGASAVRQTLERWFEPLRRGSTVRLSREGSFLLRSFIWLAQSLNEPELLSRVGEISEVEFKPKKNAEKVVRAAAEAIGQEVPAQAVKPAPSLDAITTRALSVVLSADSYGGTFPGLGGRVSIEGEVVHIRGDLDSYRLHISTGSVFRISDGRQIIVDVDGFRSALMTGVDFGGIGDLLAQILVLAEDWKHTQALTTFTE